MLAHSPPLPLVIDYSDKYWDISAEEEEGIIFALEKRDRVRRVRLQIPVPDMQMLVMAMDEEYPVLEHLIMVPSTEDKSTALTLPETLQAPHLRHLTLKGFVLPRGCRLLTTAVNIATLCLFMDHPSAYFPPNTLLRWISFILQLETLMVAFSFPVPNRDVERPPTRTPITTHVAFPNLRLFVFRGVNAYLEALVRRISAPRLEKLGIQFSKQLTFSVPRLLQFMNTTENLRFDSADLEFSRDEVHVKLHPREEAETYPLSIVVGCWPYQFCVKFLPLPILVGISLGTSAWYVRRRCLVFNVPNHHPTAFPACDSSTHRPRCSTLRMSLSLVPECASS
jgi:hypothetical protein